MSTEYNDRFAVAYRHGYLRTVRFLISHGASLDIAEEIAQAAWARGWECRHQIRNTNSIWAWVNSIGKNMLRGELRRQHQNAELPELPAVYSEELITKTEADFLLEKCCPADRLLMKRRYFEGFTAPEIAREIGSTPSAVRVRLLRIRRASRQASLHA